MVISISVTFKRHEINNTIGVLATTANVRVKSDCPMMCMNNPFCYGFMYDELQPKCNLLGCGSQDNIVSTTNAYMHAVNKLLARGRHEKSGQFQSY